MSEETAAPIAEAPAPVAPVATEAPAPTQRLGLDYYYNEDGGINQEAVDTLPDGTFKNDILHKYNQNRDGLLSGYDNKNYIASTKLENIVKPGEGASEDAIAKHNQVMRDTFGVPETPQEYGITRPDDYPEEYWDQEQTDSLLAILHKNHASPELVRELSDAQTSMALETLKAQGEQKEKAREAEIANLKETYGADFEKQVAKVEQFFNFAGFDIPEGGILDAKLTWKDMFAAADEFKNNISEDKFAKATAEKQGSALQDMKTELVNMRQDPNNPDYQDLASEDPVRVQRARDKYNRIWNNVQKITG